MANPTQERIAKPYEKNLKELLHPDDSLEEALKTKYIAAAHQRILQPLFIFAEALLALNFLLKGYYQRRGRQKKIIAAVLCAFTLRATMMSLINMNGKWEGALYFAYALYSIVLLLNGYFLFSFKKTSLKIPFATQKT
jgi:lipopolysaccharide export LptBFGC system permease protein LptF